MSTISIHEEHRPNTLRIATIGISVGRLKKKLLVLDLNGLLADIVFPPPKHMKADATIARKACKK